MKQTTPEQIADQAIGLFLEYRDKHGKTEDHARARAIREAIAGVEELERAEGAER